MIRKNITVEQFARICGAFVFLWTALVHQGHFDNPTAVSRQNLLHSLSSHGVWHIDDYHENTPDKAYARGHYYCDKAPGVVLLTLPPYALSVQVLHWVGMDVKSKSSWRLLSWLSTATVLAPLLGLAAWHSVRRLSTWLPPFNAWVIIAGVLLGGMPVIYSSILFSHGLVVSCLLLAACHIGILEVNGKIPGTRDLVLAGGLLGLALASEYTSGIIVLVLGSLVLRHGSRALAFLIAGSLLPLATIPIYSWITIGSPFKLPYSFQASFTGMQEGIYGIKWPSIKLAWILLFSPERGLFFWSPSLLLGLLGLGYLFRQNRRLFLAIYVGCFLQVLVMSGREFEWLAGLSFGPRYLSPTLVLFVIPLAYASQRHAITTFVLAVLSIGITGFALLTNPMSYGERNPLVDVMYESLRRGEGATTLWHIVGAPLGVGLSTHYGLLLLGFGVLCYIGWKLVGVPLFPTHVHTRDLNNAATTTYFMIK